MTSPLSPPNPHAANHAVGGEDYLSPASIGALQGLTIGASQASNFTATAGTLYPCSAALTCTLPTNPTVGTQVGIYRTTASTQIIMTAGAGGNIGGISSIHIPAFLLGADPIIIVQAVSSTTWVPTNLVSNDGAMGFVFGGAVSMGSSLAVTGLFNSVGGMAGHLVTKSATYTTLNTDWWVKYTSGTVTVTLGTTSMTAGQQQLISNIGSGTLTMAAATGTYNGPPTIGPSSGAIFQYDGTNWYCMGSWGNAAGIDSTASDIQPIGTQAAGSKGVAADAGHVHAMTSLSGNIPSDVTLSSAGQAKVFDTASLGVGVWLVNVSTLMSYSGGAAVIEVELTTDGATATFSGIRSSAWETNLAVPYFTAAISCIVTVTVAGTLQLVGYNNGGAHPVIFKATTPNTAAYANATGYTAIQIG